jgi:hypothetical protein
VSVDKLPALVAATSRVERERRLSHELGAPRIARGGKLESPASEVRTVARIAYANDPGCVREDGDGGIVAGKRAFGELSGDFARQRPVLEPDIDGVSVQGASHRLGNA